MEHGQFYHYELYGRSNSKAKQKKNSNLYTILGEAFRESKFSSHVDRKYTEMYPPEIVYGMEINENVSNNEKLEIQKEKLIKMAENYAKSKHLREIDGCIMAGVISYPPETTKERHKEIQENLVIPFLIKKWGENLRCVISHYDEYFWDDEEKIKLPHIQDHFYVIPDAINKIRLTELHTGKAAKRKAIAGNAGNDGKKHSDKAYREAMIKEQDEFFEEVGKEAGWKRTTVNGIRYTRDRVKIWKKNQKENLQNIMEQKKEADNICKNLINNANIECSNITTEANKLLIEAKEKSDEAEKMMKKASFDIEFSKKVSKIIKINDEKNRNLEQKFINEASKINLNNIHIPRPEKKESVVSYYRKINGWIKGFIKKMNDKEKYLIEKENELKKKIIKVDSILNRLLGKHGNKNKINQLIILLQEKLKNNENKENKTGIGSKKIT